MRVLQLAASLAFLSCAACSSDDDKSPGTEVKTTTTTVVTAIEPKSGNTTLEGTGTFVQIDGRKTTLTLTVTGAPPGDHGAHIHETGDCSAADAATAGGHWNPATHDHGMPGPAAHLGDLGNLTVEADGSGTITIEKAEWNIGGEAGGDILDKAVVIHEKVDDFGQPTGNAGGRIGCGVIDPGDVTEEESPTTTN